MQTLPDKALNDEEVERKWGQDLDEYAVCRNKHGELVRAIQTRDAKVRGE